MHAAMQIVYAVSDFRTSPCQVPSVQNGLELFGKSLKFIKEDTPGC